jgi:hypothetical protein
VFEGDYDDDQGSWDCRSRLTAQCETPDDGLVTNIRIGPSDGQTTEVFGTNYFTNAQGGLGYINYSSDLVANATSLDYNNVFLFTGTDGNLYCNLRTVAVVQDTPTSLDIICPHDSGAGQCVVQQYPGQEF